MTHPWFAWIAVDHLYPDCPNRLRAEKMLRESGWWELDGTGVNPYGTDVCGMCVARHDQKAAK